LMCVMLVAAVPIAAGVTIHKGKTSQPTNLFDTTVLHGIVLFKRVVDGGKNIRFFAIRIQYVTVSADGDHRTGVIKLRPIVIPDSMRGYYRNFFLVAVFHGTVD
jgi:hypothetical protein